MVFYMYPTLWFSLSRRWIASLSGEDGAESLADGFTQLADLDFDKDGNLLALQYADEAAWKGNLEGSLIQVAPDGTRTTLISAGEGIKSVLPLVLVLMVLFMSQTKAMSQEKGKYLKLA